MLSPLSVAVMTETYFKVSFIAKAFFLTETKEVEMIYFTSFLLNLKFIPILLFRRLRPLDTPTSSRSRPEKVLIK